MIDSDALLESKWGQMPRVLAIVPEPLTACMMWRVMWPFSALTSRGFVADWIMASEVASIENGLSGDRYNAVVTPRFVFQSPEDFSNAMKKQGIRWIFEMDDDLISPDSIYRQMTIYKGRQDIEDGLEANRQNALLTVQLADLITVSSDPLAELVSRYTDKPVRVVPNMINVEAFRMGLPGKTRVTPGLTIGWSGGIRDDSDLEVLTKAWPVVASRYPNVNFVVAGYECRSLIDCLPKERVTYIPGVSFSEYPGTLLSIDIGCCVVDDNSWNNCKTGVKWMEMSLAGSVCVVSKSMYGRYVVDGQNALVAETDDEWVNELSVLVENELLRFNLTRQAQKSIVVENSLKNNWWKWPTAWLD